MLSNLAQVFGLLDLVKKILERRRQQTDPSQGQVLNTLNSESGVQWDVGMQWELLQDTVYN